MSDITLAKVRGNFVERTLFPFVSLRQPENPMLKIERRALPAQGFLTANFDQPVHALALPLREAIPSESA
ncbi:hypothetical protein AOQ71_20020 [Bradyrhizobium manausense]|uniref:Uncharacterized protein n=1 Tax=Bradyrhizobium manausense TaxID=989370 RepID=A0A0R3DK33_9BRAD|nr:hypothetical protein AOQ71_20020 [Bradyrhizobium manausense]